MLVDVKGMCDMCTFYIFLYCWNFQITWVQPLSLTWCFWLAKLHISIYSRLELFPNILIPFVTNLQFQILQNWLHFQTIPTANEHIWTYIFNKSDQIKHSVLLPVFKIVFQNYKCNAWQEKKIQTTRWFIK